MSYIHFKSVYNKNYDKVTFDAVSLNIGQLKKLIIEKSKFSKQLDFELEITNADSNEVYRNENELVMKNARVHVKRIMKSSTVPLRSQPAKMTPTPVLTTAASEAAAAFSQLKPTPPQIAPVIPSKPLTPVVVPTIEQPKLLATSASTSQLQQAAQITPQVNPPSMSHSVSASNVTSMQKTMSKSVYDSLAPLNLPSKPLNYGQDNEPKPELELSQVNNMLLTSESSISTKTDDPRQDEKLKLESILLSSMNSQSQIGPSQGGPKSSQYSSNNTMLLSAQALESGAQAGQPMSAQAILQQQQMQSQNRFTGGQWPPRMPLGQHRPLPANYRCTICKKPGHPKNLCPDAVIKILFKTFWLGKVLI